MTRDGLSEEGGAGDASRYCCPKCGSEAVELCFPVWVVANDIDNRERWELDAEAEPEDDSDKGWCPHCGTHVLVRKKAKEAAAMATPALGLEESTQALVAIHALMDGKEWSADTLQDIAGVLTRAGFRIHEPEEDDDGP